MELVFPPEYNNLPQLKTIKQVFDNGRFPHAVLLEGNNDDTFKLSLFIAKALVCSDNDFVPCGKCSSCIKAEHSSHPDIQVLGGTGAKNSFHKEDISDLRINASIKPNEAKCRIFILKNAENMSIQAQNSILKIIEEPFGDSVFILTTQNSSLLLDTIKSRTEIFSILSGQNTLDEISCKVAYTISCGTEFDIMTEFFQFSKDRLGFCSLMDSIICIYRDCIAVKLGHSPIIFTDADKIANSLTIKKLYNILACAQKMKTYAQQNCNMNLVITSACSFFYKSRQ